MSSDGESGPGTTTVVTPQGRVTIPAQVRREAGIDPGDTVVVYLEDGRVVIETRAQLMARIHRDVAASWTGPASAADDLIAERRAEVVAEDREL